MKKRKKIFPMYRLNPFCICYDCINYNPEKQEYAHSCKKYNELYGIPTEIWNRNNAHCEAFIEKKDTNG